MVIKYLKILARKEHKRKENNMVLKWKVLNFVCECPDLIVHSISLSMFTLF